MICGSCGTDNTEGAAFCSKCGAKLDTADNSGGIPPAAGVAGDDTDRILAIIAHLGGAFFFFVPALVIFLIKNEQPGWVRNEAMEALNWQITVAILGAISTVMMVVLIGIFMWWLLYVVNFILCIVAAIAVSGRKPFRYPFAIRLIK